MEIGMTGASDGLSRNGVYDDGNEKIYGMIGK